jgi:hypothetical protein
VKEGGSEMPAKKKIGKSAAKKKTPRKAAARKPAAGKTGRVRKSAIDLKTFLDEIRKRAYQIFQERGWVHGSDLDDWLKAEKEIKKKYGIN